MLLGLLGSPAMAQTSPPEYLADPGFESDLPPETDFIAGPKYAQMVRQILEGGVPEGFNFTVFRSFYVRTRDYTPLAEDLITRMRDQAFVIEEGRDRAKALEARQAYEALLRSHLANLDVVTQALSLSRQDPVFGDPQMLSAVREGLIRSVTANGNGRSLVAAYRVITPAEEDALLSALDFEVMHTTSDKTGGVYYNMHYGVFRATGEPFTLFVNIEAPVRHLERERIRAGRRLDLRSR
ncbi:MAG: hypothetical protein K9G62_02805 [Alphaproteobacteria bacterium]|nr:hypothetical protein [Alphaproteobacteria bacterium]